MAQEPRYASIAMKVTRSANFANTAIVGNVTYRMVGVYGIPIVVGILLMLTPIFRWNIPAMIAYIALASIIVGQTPTQRTMLSNIYGILFKKPLKTVVTELTTANTLGHGIREVLWIDDIDVPVFRMYDKKYKLVYTVTSGITRWSDDDEYIMQAINIKSLFNVMEGGESLQIVTKTDADTGMLQLEHELEKAENFEGDDLQALADKRRGMLHTVATQEVGRSVQQYAILTVKAKNVGRTVKALKHASRLIRPATSPGDVLLSAMGFEAGADQVESYE